MQLVLKFAATLIIVLLCSYLSRKMPSLAGLIVVMPVSGLMVLLWIGLSGSEHPQTLISYSRGALWGIFPTLLFYTTTLICLSKELPLSFTLVLSSSLWLCGAVIHQLVFR